MVDLTVKIPANEVDALRFACAHTDEALFVHEFVDESLVATVTLQVRSIEMLFYLIRSFDEKVEHEKFKANYITPKTSPSC